MCLGKERRINAQSRRAPVVGRHRDGTGTGRDGMIRGQQVAMELDVEARHLTSSNWIYRCDGVPGSILAKVVDRTTYQ